MKRILVPNSVLHEHDRCPLLIYHGLKLLCSQVEICGFVHTYDKVESMSCLTRRSPDSCRMEVVLAVVVALQQDAVCLDSLVV